MAVRINSAYDAARYYASRTTKSTSVKSTSNAAKSSSSAKSSAAANASRYGYKNASTSCATFALATALSIYNDEQITPDEIDTNSDTDGQGTQFGNHGAKYIEGSVENTFDGIDKELSLGNPVLIHTSGKDKNGNDSEHWATVIGKEGDNYTIIDPWGGKECSLEEMQIYKKDGEVLGYATIS